MRKKEELYDDVWMYILLLVTLTILMESVKNYTFMIANTSLRYSLFLLPLTYLIVNYIAKKYDYKKAVAAIAISAVMFVSFSGIIAFAIGDRLILTSISGEFIGYVASHFISLTIYLFLLNNTTSPTILIYLNYLFALIVYQLFYTLIHINLIVLDNFWTEYFITLAMQAIICIPISIIDKNIKRGREIIK